MSWQRRRDFKRLQSRQKGLIAWEPNVSGLVIVVVLVVVGIFAHRSAVRAREGTQHASGKYSSEAEICLFRRNTYDRRPGSSRQLRLGEFL